MSTADRTDDQAEQPGITLDYRRLRESRRRHTTQRELPGTSKANLSFDLGPAKRICLSFDLVGKRLGFYFADKYLASIGPSQNVC